MEVSLDLIARGLEELGEHIRNGLTFRRCLGFGFQLDVVLHCRLQKIALIVADSQEDLHYVHGHTVHKTLEVFSMYLPYVLITFQCCPDISVHY
jgi:hypothetical protein